MLLSAGLAIAGLRPALVVRWPRLVLALLLLVTAAAAAALVRPEPLGLRLEIDPSTEPLLPVGDAGYASYQAAVRDFGDDQVFVVAMETDDLFVEENLTALRRVSDRLSRLEGVRGVQSLVRVTSFRYVPEEDWIEVRPFVEDVPTNPGELRSLRQRALGDPVYRRTLVSDDGRTAALNVNFRKMTDREFIAADLDGQVRSILAEEGGNGRRFHVSGRPHIKSQMYHLMTRDLLRLIPIGLFVVAVVLALASGTIRGVVLPLGTVTMAVVWTFGAIAFLGRPLTVLTVLLAPTLVAIGSVYGVHVVNRYEEEALRSEDRGAAVLGCLHAMIVPVLIAGITTMIGFGALLITDVPAVFEIGAFSVLGIASITLISLTGVPASLVLLPLRRGSEHGARGGRFAAADRLGVRLDRHLDALVRASGRRANGVLFTWAALSVTALALIPRIVIDTDYLTFFDEGAPVRREFEAVNRLLAGAVPLYVVFEGPEAGYLRDPAVLRAVEALQRRIDEVPGVSRTLSFIDTLRLLNRAVEGGDPDAERVPDSRGAVTELLFMIPKEDMQRFMTVDQSAANLIVRTGEVGSAAMRAVTEGIETAIAAAALPPELEVRVTGNAILLNRAADGVARSQPRTVGLAALGIFVLLATALRSVRFGLVAMIPNIVPVLIFFGVLGAGVAPLSLPTSLIGSVALGLAIDATAHHLVRYRAERRAGLSPAEATLLVGRKVGRPVAVASVTLILGFLSVTFSEFQTLRQFGYLSALTMAVCALADLVLLPALLIRLRL